MNEIGLYMIIFNQGNTFIFLRTLQFCLVQNKMFQYLKMKKRKRTFSLYMNPTENKA